MEMAAPQPPTWRLLLGFITGPGIAALIFAAVFPAYDGLTSFHDRVWRTFYLVLWVVYPLTLIFGLPLYRFLRGRVRPSILNCGLAGAAVSGLPWFLMGMVATPDWASAGNVVTIEHHMRTFAGWLEFLQIIGVAVVLGFIAGVVFWLCVAMGSSTQQKAA